MVLPLVTSASGLNVWGFARYIYLEPVCPPFWGLNPPTQGLFQSKQGSFGFQVCI